MVTLFDAILISKILYNCIVYLYYLPLIVFISLSDQIQNMISIKFFFF